VLLINHGSEPFTIRRGDRIAQIVSASGRAGGFSSSSLHCLDRFAADGGFGSTGP